MRRAPLLLLIPLALLVACSHTATVPMPSDPGDQGGWSSYYEDQFKAHGDKVAAPVNTASPTQKAAYESERSSYQRRKTIGMIGAIASLAIGVGLFVGTLSQL